MASLRPLAVRVDSFARAAVLVERAIGFPAEIQMAAWSLATSWGRDERDWLDGRKFTDAVLFHAKLMQEAAEEVKGEGFLSMADFLDPFYPGLAGQVSSGNLQIACENARREQC